MDRVGAWDGLHGLLHAAGGVVLYTHDARKKGTRVKDGENTHYPAH
jgi:hypothetical protein